MGGLDRFGMQPHRAAAAAVAPSLQAACLVVAPSDGQHSTEWQPMEPMALGCCCRSQPASLPPCPPAEGVHRILSSEFARSSLLIHKGVDCQRFCPGPRSTAAPSKVLPEAAGPASSASTAQLCGCSPTSAGGCSGTVQTQIRGQGQGQPLLPPLPPLRQQDVQQQQAQQQQQQSVLLVGNPGLCLKGFECAVATLARVNRSRPIQVRRWDGFECVLLMCCCCCCRPQQRVLKQPALPPLAPSLQVNWICQQQPAPEVIARIAAAGLHVRLFLDPPQVRRPSGRRTGRCCVVHLGLLGALFGPCSSRSAPTMLQHTMPPPAHPPNASLRCSVQSMLPALYRGHDCLLFTSKYEAWGMPVSSKSSRTALRLRALLLCKLPPGAGAACHCPA